MAVLASVGVKVAETERLAGDARERVRIGEETPQYTRSTFGRLIKKDTLGADQSGISSTASSPSSS